MRRDETFEEAGRRGGSGVSAVARGTGEFFQPSFSNHVRIMNWEETKPIFFF